MSGAKCSLGIYHWGAGLAVTGQIRDSRQNVLQSYFQTGSNNSPNYFRIFLFIAFLEEAFIRDIIIKCTNYTIVMFINNAVINNKLRKILILYFAIQNSHGHAKGFLRNL